MSETTPPATAGESAILEAIERLDRKLTTHGEHIDTHRGRLDKHDSLLQSHTNQLMSHSQMLTEHAKLHTDHARGIIAAQEQARTARQSSSELAKESKAFAEAVGTHMARVEKANADKLDAIVLSNARAEDQRQLQTMALQRLVTWQSTRWFRLALVAGAFVGGVIAGIVSRLLAAGH